MLTYYDDAMIQCTTYNTSIPGMTIMMGLGNNSIKIAAVLCLRWYRTDRYDMICRFIHENDTNKIDKGILRRERRKCKIIIMIII